MDNELWQFVRDVFLLWLGIVAFFAFLVLFAWLMEWFF